MNICNEVVMSHWCIKYSMCVPAESYMRILRVCMIAAVNMKGTARGV